MLSVTHCKASQNGVAFLVHPRNVSDIIRKYPFLKILPSSVVLWLMRHFWPVTVARIEGITNRDTGKQAPGWVIASPLTAGEMLRDRELARQSIVDAARLAEAKGASVIGLGAYTASLSRGGIDVAEATNLRVTTGRLYTAKTVTTIMWDALVALDKDATQARISIVGAGGSIGSGCAQILASKQCQNLHLIDLTHKAEHIEALVAQLQKLYPDISVSVSHDIASIKQSDAIIAATNHPDALIKDEYLHQGVVVVDDAQPSDVEDVSLVRDDILVLEGGVVHTDSIRIPFNFGLQNQGDIFSCLAEAIILAGNPDISIDTVGKMEQVDFDTLGEFDIEGKRIGLTRGVFQNAKRVYTDEDIARVREIASEK